MAVYLAVACQTDEPSLLSDNEQRVLASLSLDQLQPLPASPSNHYANDPQAANLGRALFFDARFSGNKQLSCASCHQPKNAFTDQLDRAIGVHKTGRNTPTIIGAAWQNWFYWDGRKDSLWSQALVPFEAADEMASSRTEVVRLVGSDADYRQQYEKIFGRFPVRLLDPALPNKAGPLGDSMMQNNWYRIDTVTQKAINHVYANLGKAVAAYERQLPFTPTRFDAFAVAVKDGDMRRARTLFSANELAGLQLFLDQSKTQCLRCHNGPLLSNRGFHNIGSGTFTGKRLDFGRLLGLQAVLLDEFNCLGPYSDAKPEDCSQLRFTSRDTHALQGAFKTPSLRNLTRTAPYFHDGRYKTLEQAIAHYVELRTGDADIQPIYLNSREIGQLATFLATLSDPVE